MPDLANLADGVKGFPIHGRMMRYSAFMPRLYNLCKSLGFRPGKMLPSRAFCSDESQGYPVILLAKHFGAFPFNHGRVGGVVATGRHGPHAHHGEDLILIQASHVGYDPDTRTFGTYRRLQTEGHGCSPTCGKIAHVLEWYLEEYRFACENLALVREDGRVWVQIDNHLLREHRSEGLILDLGQIIEEAQGRPTATRVLSTAKRFPAAQAFVERMGHLDLGAGEVLAVGQLPADLFRFARPIAEATPEGEHDLERNLIRFMPSIVTAESPLLVAAQLNTEVEFDRTYRTIVKNHTYRGKRLFFISGLHIDISPKAGQIFPLTKFIPWAAYLQHPDGSHQLIEQEELWARLKSASTENPDAVDLEQAIEQMAQAQEVRIEP